MKRKNRKQPIIVNTADKEYTLLFAKDGSEEYDVYDEIGNYCGAVPFYMVKNCNNNDDFIIALKFSGIIYE